MQDETSKKIKKAVPKKAVPKKAAAAKPEAIQSAEKIKKTATPKKAVAKKSVARKSSVKKDKDIVVINFQLTYGTRFGQNIFLSGNIPQLGSAHDENALKLQYIDHLHWGGEIKISLSDIPEEGLKYFYIVRHEDGSADKSAPYLLLKSDLVKDVHVFDAWNYSGYPQNAFTSKVFDVLVDKTKASVKKSSATVTHQFKIAAPELPENHVIFLTGNGSELGNWSEEDIIFLEPQEHAAFWSAAVNLKLGEDPIEYKYGIYDIVNKVLVSFEEGENRVLGARAAVSFFSIVNDGFIRYN